MMNLARKSTYHFQNGATKQGNENVRELENPETDSWEGKQEKASQ